MKELIEVSKTHNLSPKSQFPELIFASNENVLHGLFFLYLAIFVLDMIAGEILNSFIFIVFASIVIIILIYKTSSCFLKSYRYQTFEEFYSVKLYYKKISYGIASIPRGRRKEYVHEYTIDLTTLPQLFINTYSLQEKIKSIPKQKAGFFFPTDDLASTYRIFIDDEICMRTNKFASNFSTSYAESVIGEHVINTKLLSMKNTDILLADYLPNGDIINTAYQDSLTENITFLSKNILNTSELKSQYTPLFVALIVFTMPLLIYQQWTYVNNGNFENEFWYRLTAFFCFTIFASMIYLKMRFSATKP